MTASAVGELVRSWRTARRRSQMDLALDVGVSTRHLSFVETGRARPSPELVLALADRLDVPLRERNDLLLAAGYAPRYPERSLDDPHLQRARSAMQRMLDAHDPYPGVAIDRHWNIVLANRAASMLIAAVPADLLGPPVNVFRVCLHPRGLAAHTRNLDEWAAYLLGQLRRAWVRTNDAEFAALLAELREDPRIAAIDDHAISSSAQDALVVPVDLDLDGTELSMFTTLTTFGGPRDVTLDELAVELFYPADDRTEALLRDTAAPAVA
jgi:transcriptional regulator with XRE-family HTH domain